MTKDLYVVYASDDKFAEILGVSLTSLYENNKEMEQITVYVLNSGISDESKKKLESLSGIYERKELQWLEAKDITKELGMEVAIDRGSLSQYARLFVSSVLPKDLKRVLYLDCDIIIAQSLEELWDLDMHGKTVAALKDAFSKWYRMNIDLKPNDIMFNSGVMLIDLEKWREKNIEKKLTKFISGKNGKIQQGDQGTLNAILSKDVWCFEPRFNTVTIFYDFSYKEMMTYRKPPKGYYTEIEVREATKHPVIIHFTTSFLSRRPWVKGCQHRYLGEWEKYKKLSPWKDSELWEYKKKTKVHELYVGLMRRFPRNLNIEISGALQAYGRPFINKYRLRK
ncbi:glycosyltransferase family 8 protein [Hungatella effluvii]|uniref:glycosyltransferase family 8 protein n=1 Tax=Hungatella effluvii TaxID=1096246 RepID=UPI0022E6A97F|nr:glycosyltransferase family 8 protein [Hungatella effluvii]